MPSKTQQQLNRFHNAKRVWLQVQKGLVKGSFVAKLLIEIVVTSVPKMATVKLPPKPATFWPMEESIWSATKTTIGSKRKKWRLKWNSQPHIRMFAIVRQQLVPFANIESWDLPLSPPHWVGRIPRTWVPASVLLNRTLDATKLQTQWICKMWRKQMLLLLRYWRPSNSY